MTLAPRTTYRVQLRPGFGFREAAALVPYWESLGVSHLYLSPIFQAARGSTHGYDVVDPARINEELGGEEAFLALSAALHSRGMGVLVDFVPNHMGALAGANRYWDDVLENGPASLHAEVFDIDWSPLKESLAKKLLLPILGDQYGVVLERGEIRLVREEGRFFLTYFEHRLPVAPRTLRLLVDAALHRLPLPQESEARQELESIRTAMEHLPGTEATESARRAERAREKEVIKRRIAALTRTEPAVAAALDEAVEALHGTPGDSSSWDAMDAFVQAQPYRLSSWRVASEAINYRRFFDVNGLAAIRMEHPPVFESMHALLLRLVAEGHIDGIRLDHTDGLYEPTGYFASLAAALAVAKGQEGAPSRPPLYVVAEKIVAPGEAIPQGWFIHGTTGYDFTRAAIGALVDAEGEAPLSTLYRSYTGDGRTFEQHCVEAKRDVMEQLLSSEMRMLAWRLERVAEARRSSRDFTVATLKTALVETIASFGVYRTYVRPDGRREPSDDEHIARAVRAAKRRNHAIDSSVFAFVQKVLSLEPPFDAPDCVELAMKVQQVTGPVMAKAVEDTAFYRFPRFLAENEVGGHPAHLGVSVDELHRLNAERLARFPTALLATATHDTKLGEDTRARIAVFSEAPDLLGQLTKELDAAAVGRFGEKVPAPVDRFRLAQAAVGVWPLDPRGREGLGERLAAYAVKAAREAKLHTSWLDPDGEYEEVLTTYARALVDDAALRAPVDAVASRIAAAGVSNSLAQLALRLCSPGVPDTYQGAELWHQCLVDPDNRSAVDYAARRAALRRIQEPGAGEAAVRALRDHWDDGLLKLLVLHRGLELRARHAELFAAGDYGPVDGGAHAIAFVRSRGPHAVLCAVARRPFRLAGERLPVGDVWGNRRLPGLDGRRWRDAFTGRALTSERNGLPLAELFATLPVAVAVAE